MLKLMRQPSWRYGYDGIGPVANRYVGAHDFGNRDHCLLQLQLDGSAAFFLNSIRAHASTRCGSFPYSNRQNNRYYCR